MGSYGFLLSILLQMHVNSQKYLKHNPIPKPNRKLDPKYF